MSNQLLRASQGIAFAGVVTASGGPFTGSEGLAAVAWAGGDRAPIATPTAAWLDADAGTITLALSAASLAAMEPARYRMVVKLADASAELWDGLLDVDGGPGSSSALPVYCSFEDLLSKAPTIKKWQKPDAGDLAGFEGQRAEAREWFDDLLQRHYRNGAGMLQDFAFVPGISFGGVYGPGLIWRDGRRSAELQTWLDADRLDVTRQVKDACAYRVLGQLYERQSMAVDDGASFAAIGRKFFARAEAVAAGITAEIDSDGDGTNDTVIRLGSFDTLEG